MIDNSGQVDWPGIKTAAIAMGSVNGAATQAASGLPPNEARRLIDRINKRALREQWMAKARATAVSATIVRTNAKPLSQPVQTGAIALANVLEQRKHKSRGYLSRFVVNASKVASKSRKPLQDAQNVRHVAAVMSALWPEEGGSKGLTLNIANIQGGMG